MLNFGRGKKKFNVDIGDLELYKNYKENSKHPVDYKTFKTILIEYHQEIINLMIFKGREFKMPFKLGCLRIRKKKRKIRLNKEGKVNKKCWMPDWKGTKELWETKFPGMSEEDILKLPVKDRGIKYLSNDHTGNYSCRVIWDKTLCGVKNQYFYSFRASKYKFNRRLGKELKNNPELHNFYLL